MTSKPTIILDPHARRMDEIFSPADRERLYRLAHVIGGSDAPMPQAEFEAALPDAEAVICWDWRYGNDLLRKAPKLRAIFSVEGGFPIGLDYAYCYANTIRVLSVAPSFARQVAEMCVGMALACSREIVLGDLKMRRGDEDYLHAGNTSTFMLYGQPVGIIGYGGIAHALHPLLRPFDVEVLAYDPWLGDGYLRSLGVKPKSLEALLAESRVIFVLAAPTVENRAFLGQPELAHIQQGAVMVLMSRAHVVDFDALTEYVVAGRFKLATDVFPTEPLAADHPLRSAEGAVLSAHRAGSVKEGLWEIGEMVVDDLEMVLRGFPPRRCLNAEPELSQRYATIVVERGDDE